MILPSRTIRQWRRADFAQPLVEAGPCESATPPGFRVRARTRTSDADQRTAARNHSLLDAHLGSGHPDPLYNPARIRRKRSAGPGFRSSRGGLLDGPRSIHVRVPAPAHSRRQGARALANLRQQRSRGGHAHDRDVDLMSPRHSRERPDRLAQLRLLSHHHPLAAAA